MKKAFAAFAILLMGVFTSGYVVAEKLTIVGTGSGISVLKGIAEAYMLQNPGIEITVPKSIGSWGTIRAVGNDVYFLGRIARDIADSEKGFGLTQVAFAKTPIVFFVNHNVPLSDITAEQVCKIYDGTMRKWKDIVSTGNVTIRVIRREDGDSSLNVLKETLGCFRTISLTPRSKTTFTDSETLHEVRKQKSSIAFGTWANTKDETGIHVLSLNGVTPTTQEYPCIGTLSLVYKKKNYHGNLKKFIEFLSTAAAKKAIIDAGSLPVN